MKTAGLLGRAAGLLVFAIGIAMLATVFWQSWKLFLDPGIPAGGEGGELISRLVQLVVRLAFLLAMCVAASLIASKGIQLYTAAVHRPAPHRPAASQTQDIPATD